MMVSKVKLLGVKNTWDFVFPPLELNFLLDVVYNNVVRDPLRPQKVHHVGDPLRGNHNVHTRLVTSDDVSWQVRPQVTVHGLLCKCKLKA